MALERRTTRWKYYVLFLILNDDGYKSNNDANYSKFLI